MCKLCGSVAPKGRTATSHCWARTNAWVCSARIASRMQPSHMASSAAPDHKRLPAPCWAGKITERAYDWAKLATVAGALLQTRKRSKGGSSVPRTDHFQAEDEMPKKAPESFDELLPRT